jgi:hypothetical protein
VKYALHRGAPDDLIFEIACRGYTGVGFKFGDFAPSQARFAALAAAVRFKGPISSNVSEKHNYRGAEAEVEKLTTELTVAFKQYCKRFRAEHGVKPADQFIDDDPQ